MVLLFTHIEFGWRPYLIPLRTDSEQGLFASGAWQALARCKLGEGGIDMEANAYIWIGLQSEGATRESDSAYMDVAACTSLFHKTSLIGPWTH